MCLNSSGTIVNGSYALFQANNTAHPGICREDRDANRKNAGQLPLSGRLSRAFGEAVKLSGKASKICCHLRRLKFIAATPYFRQPVDAVVYGLYLQTALGVNILTYNALSSIKFRERSWTFAPAADISLLLKMDIRLYLERIDRFKSRDRTAGGNHEQLVYRAGNGVS
jgi:hypothetical protein